MYICCYLYCIHKNGVNRGRQLYWVSGCLCERMTSRVVCIHRRRLSVRVGLTQQANRLRHRLSWFYSARLSKGEKALCAAATKVCIEGHNRLIKEMLSMCGACVELAGVLIISPVETVLCSWFLFSVSPKEHVTVINSCSLNVT